MKIQKFNSFSNQDSMTEDFINSFDKMLIEATDENTYKSVEKKVISDLKLNTRLVFTFGAGIGGLYPIIDKLMKNTMSLQSVELTPETIVMLTMSSFAIIYIEEKKFKDEKEEQILIKDSKSLLEELKMRGVGNGIVKKVMKVIASIKNIFSLIAKHLGAIVENIVDMFAYTSLLIPIMNGVLYVVGKYELNLDTICENFLGLAMGIGTVIAKHGILAIINKIKDRFKINPKEVIDEIETPIQIQKFSTFGETEEQQQGDLIKEQ